MSVWVADYTRPAKMPQFRGNTKLTKYRSGVGLESHGRYSAGSARRRDSRPGSAMGWWQGPPIHTRGPKWMYIAAGYFTKMSPYTWKRRHGWRSSGDPSAVFSSSAFLLFGKLPGGGVRTRLVAWVVEAREEVGAVEGDNVSRFGRGTAGFIWRLGGCWHLGPV